MIFIHTELEGAFVIEPERLSDERGFFARTWCKKEFIKNGLNPDLVQCNISFNLKKGTLRGMHYQVAPYEETKLVRCTSGAIHDVIIDLRPASLTFRQWFGIKLSSENKMMLYIPEGFCHGFLTLQNNTEIFYQMSQYYVPESSRGIRWNDPLFNIQWPNEITVISERDKNYPDFKI